MTGYLPSFCFRSIHLYSRIRRDAALYAPPPKRQAHCRGRPPKHGHRLPTPQQLSLTTRTWITIQVSIRGQLLTRLVHVRGVLWYGVCPTALVRWVIVRDPEGKEPADSQSSQLLRNCPLEVPVLPLRQSIGKLPEQPCGSVLLAFGLEMFDKPINVICGFDGGDAHGHGPLYESILNGPGPYAGKEVIWRSASQQTPTCQPRSLSTQHATASGH